MDGGQRHNFPIMALPTIHQLKDARTTAGARELWIIHPGGRRLDACDLAAGKGGPPRAFHPGETLATALPPGFRLDIARLFA